MTARILVVDDMPVNRRLLEARLSAEYYDVLTAEDGAEALEICRREPVDLVLLDVMMPHMNGFEVCRRIKSDPSTQHLPVVLITALDQKEDRLAGLEAGADDFLTKPVRDLPLLSRVRSLTRLKRVTDELRGRAETAAMLAMHDPLGDLNAAKRPVLVHFPADATSSARFTRLMRDVADLETVDTADDLTCAAADPNVDAVVIDLIATAHDPLRLISLLRSNSVTRLVPIIAVTALDDDRHAARALELGANDYVQLPLDRSELLVRLRTQSRRRRYDDDLRRSVDQTLELAISDSLTGLYNRRFLEAHLARAVEEARTAGTTFSILVADIDHFKRVNDGWGHEAGDRVLREFSARLKSCLRSSDLAARIGGEEFAVLMLSADIEAALAVADRIRSAVGDSLFDIGDEMIAITVSEGIASFDKSVDDAVSLLRRADDALYTAKRSGRNQVSILAA